MSPSSLVFDSNEPTSLLDFGMKSAKPFDFVIERKQMKTNETKKEEIMKRRSGTPVSSYGVTASALGFCFQ